MSDLYASVDDTYDDFNTHNVPGSKEKEPVKSEIRALLYRIIGALLDAAAASVGAQVARETKTQLDALQPQAAGVLGAAMTGTGKGVYKSTGSAWVLTSIPLVSDLSALISAVLTRMDAAELLLGSAVVDCGTFTPAATSGSVGYPTTGGTGTSGAIKKGNQFFASADGYVRDKPIKAGDSVKANTDNPLQVEANWQRSGGSIGYTAENAGNKITSLSGTPTNTQYLAAAALKTLLDAKADGAATTSALGTKADAAAVTAALNLKLDTSATTTKSREFLALSTADTMRALLNAALDADLAELRAVIDAVSSSDYVRNTLGWAIAFSLVDPDNAGLRYPVVGVNKVSGALEAFRFKMLSLGTRKKRAQRGIEDGYGNDLITWDQRNKARFDPDELTVSRCSGQIPEASLPTVAGRKAIAGTYGATYDRLWSDAWGGTLVPYRRDLATGAIRIDTALSWELLLVIGQSNAVGSTNPVDDSANLLSALRYVEGAFTFNTNYPWRGPSANTLTTGSATNFVQVLESKSGDLEDTGIANSIAEYNLLRGKAGLSPIPIVGSACGIAGQAWSVIKKGGSGVAWANSLVMATDAKTIATGKGVPIIMRKYRIVHGEADAVLNPAAGTYKGYMVTLKTDINTDFPPILGQTESILLVIAQLATRTDGVTSAASSQISHDQHEAALENEGIILGGIGYVCESFGIHYTNRGRRYFMEQMAKNEFRSEQMGRDVCHLYIKSAVYSTSGGYKVLCTVGGDRVGKMRRRNTSANAGWLNPHPTAGLTISSSSGAATITAISFPADDQILITLSGALGTSPMLNVGYNNGGGNAASNYPYDYTDICDEDATSSLEYPDRGLPNFLAVHKIAIT